MSVDDRPASGIGRRRWVRRQLISLDAVGDGPVMNVVVQRLHEELRVQLAEAGMVPEPQQGSVTLYMNVVELPRMVDGVPQAVTLDEQGHARPLRREPYPTGGQEVPAWAGAVELLLEAFVVPVVVPTDRYPPLATPPEQHPDASPPCWAPTEMVRSGLAEYYCQRGTGHPSPHEVMPKGGDYLRWGPESAEPSDGADPS